MELLKKYDIKQSAKQQELIRNILRKGKMYGKELNERYEYLEEKESFVMPKVKDIVLKKPKKEVKKKKEEKTDLDYLFGNDDYSDDDDDDDDDQKKIIISSGFNNRDIKKFNEKKFYNTDRFSFGDDFRQLQAHIPEMLDKMEKKYNYAYTVVSVKERDEIQKAFQKDMKTVSDEMKIFNTPYMKLMIDKSPSYDKEITKLSKKAKKEITNILKNLRQLKTK